MSVPLRERVADMLAENDAAGPGPVSRSEYLADADALINLINEDKRSVSVEPVATLSRCPVCGALSLADRPPCPACFQDNLELAPVPVSPTADLEALQRICAEWESSCDQYRKWWKTAERERDEAREALRELVAAHDRHDFTLSELTSFEEDEVSRAVLARAREVGKGVERTRALVPNKSLIALATCAYGATMAAISDGFCEPDRVWLHDTAIAADRAARGESVQWPETER